ncbi:gamma carbonic anhydrase family protein [Rhizobacter sp. Root404]|uniref:gamma carbonic anhydrase family protein n=1 Tax=Rhizobacter sp. Root404 TaxID=1736528 RepID=UPI0009E6DC36|nr:gamma carbonic anhydrase family protein [Rhizobacter sp. Root404]
MLLKTRSLSPIIDPSARVAPTAVISGDVHIGPNTSIGHGVVIAAEGGSIHIGQHCVIMDTAVLRGVPNQPLRLGNHVLVGPRAYLVGCTIEDEVFIATGGTVFNGAVIGRNSQVRINGLVHLRTTLEPGSMVPIGWVAVGTPAKILPTSDHDGIWAIQQTLDFSGYVFNIKRPADGSPVMKTLMERYSSALCRMRADESPVRSE